MRLCKILLSGPHAPEMYCIAQLAPIFNTLEAVWLGSTPYDSQLTIN